MWKSTSGSWEKSEEESFSEGTLSFTTVPSAVHEVAEVKAVFMLVEKLSLVNKIDAISSSRL